MNDILMTCDQNQCTLLVMLDLSAAFDTVNHSILIKRLETQVGLQGTVIDWTKSYLQDRTQSVMITNCCSTKKTKDCDVPQGSVLGPDDYSDFTVPLGDLIRNHCIIPSFYADDSQKYTHFDPKSMEDTERAIKQMESCCDNVKSWFTCYHLKT